MLVPARGARAAARPEFERCRKRGSSEPPRAPATLHDTHFHCSGLSGFLPTVIMTIGTPERYTSGASVRCAPGRAWHARLLFKLAHAPARDAVNHGGIPTLARAHSGICELVVRSRASDRNHELSRPYLWPQLEPRHARARHAVGRARRLSLIFSDCLSATGAKPRRLDDPALLEPSAAGAATRRRWCCRQRLVAADGAGTR